MTIANKITIFRILLVPAFIVTVLYHTPERDSFRYIALTIFCIASLSDALDGYLARARNETTLAGAILDPLADKALIISAFICLYTVGVDFPVYRFPKWLVVGMISRDVILILGSTVIHMLHKEAIQEQGPTWLGKTTTVLGMLCIITMLLQVPRVEYLWIVTVAFAGVSLIDYMIKGITFINK